MKEYQGVIPRVAIVVKQSAGTPLTSIVNTYFRPRLMEMLCCVRCLLAWRIEVFVRYIRYISHVLIAYFEEQWKHSFGGYSYFLSNMFSCIYHLYPPLSSLPHSHSLFLSLLLSLSPNFLLVTILWTRMHTILSPKVTCVPWLSPFRIGYWKVSI